MSGGYGSSGFEIANVLDARAYPTARARRAGPPPSGIDPASQGPTAAEAPPRARLWHFFLREQGIGRATAASPRFTGPCFLKNLSIHANTGAAGAVIGSVQLFWRSTTYVTAANLAVDPAPGGTPIIESTLASDNETTTGEGGILIPATGVSGYPIPLNYYIPDSGNIFLGATMRMPAAIVEYLGATLLLYEGVLPTDWPALIG